MTVEKESISKVAIGIFIFTAAMGLAIITNNPSAFAVGQVIGALIMGLLMGCIPYYQARKVKKHQLAQISLASCMLAGLILGIILALPTAVIFTIYIKTSE